MGLPISHAQLSILHELSSPLQLQGFATIVLKLLLSQALVQLRTLVFQCHLVLLEIVELAFLGH